MSDLTQPKACRRCLLADLENSQEIQDYVKRTGELLPPSERCADDEYRSRLDVCRECDFLADATCAKCGCYVEIRALRRGNHCPLPKRRW